MSPIAIALFAAIAVALAGIVALNRANNKRLAAMPPDERLADDTNNRIEMQIW